MVCNLLLKGRKEEAWRDANGTASARRSTIRPVFSVLFRLRNGDYFGVSDVLAVPRGRGKEGVLANPMFFTIFSKASFFLHILTGDALAAAT
jgi:hypothetical protein